MSIREFIPDSNTIAGFAPRHATLQPDEPTQAVYVQAAYETGFQGAFIDSDDVPLWSRKIAKSVIRKFKAERGANDWSIERTFPAALQGSGAGKRACNFQYIQKVLANALAGSQSFGNCVAWAKREISNTILGMNIATGDLGRVTHRHGTALVYGLRGSSGQGMSLSDSFETVTKIGQSEEKNYEGIADLSTQALDENAGNKWGRGGPPDALAKAVSGDTLRKAWMIESPTADIIRDILWNEGCVDTGSSYTAAGPCNPIAKGLKGIGGHDQAYLGYDDTDEFRELHAKTTGQKLSASEFVVFMDQSWGPSWIDLSNWYETLWGPRPEGMVCLLSSDALRLCGGRSGEAWGVVGAAGFLPPRMPDWGGWVCL